jgi:TolB protein
MAPFKVTVLSQKSWNLPASPRNCRNGAFRTLRSVVQIHSPRLVYILLAKVNCFRVSSLVIFLAVSIFASACSQQYSTYPSRTVPHQGDWGIYALELSTQDVELIWSTSQALSYLCLNHAGDKFAFSSRIGGTLESNEEIFTIGIDGAGLRQLTNNSYWDLYPCFSPDDSKIAFLSKRNSTLDIYTMDSDGGNEAKLYDSGFHDADISWGSGGRIAFTRNSQVWTVKDDGTDARQLTNPPRAGEWGNANLPFGDYDPRFSPDGNRIVFERLDADASPHGNYNLYVIDSNGTGETKLTNNGYSQGLVSWSHSGDIMAFIVAAIGTEGKYDIYVMNSDGTNLRNVTPDYFPPSFLCLSAMFSKDDSKIYFAGQWYK